MTESMWALWNPAAGSTREGEALRRRLADTPRLRLIETESADDLRRRVKEAAEAQVGHVVAAGGDGTVHGVVEALADTEAPPALGIIPLGTGNDTVRSLATPLDPEEALDALLEGRTRVVPVDLVEVETREGRFRGINTFMAGNAVRVMEMTTSEAKAQWGALAYFQSSLRVLSDLQTFSGQIRIDDEPPLALEAVNLHLGNGRCSSGGFPSSPEADPSDGWLDLVVVSPAPLPELALAAARHLLGDGEEDPRLLCRRVQRVEFDFEPRLDARLDGEAIPAPLGARVLPGVLPVHVGPSF